ncbi:MAG: porin [Pseudomonadota bacterium]
MKIALPHISKFCRRPLAIAAGGLLLGFAAGAHAQPETPEEPPALKLSGFGTLGASYHTAPGVTVRRDISQAQGAQGGQLSFTPDSMLAVQADWRISPHWDAALQLMSRARIPNNYNPQVSWGYVKYKPADDFSLRAGRIGIEIYLHDDSAEIGYANLPIRPAITYIPRTANGADAEWLQPLGQGTLRGKLMAGQTIGALQTGINAPNNINAAPTANASLEYALNGWTARLAYFTIKTRNTAPETQPGSALYTLLNMLPNGTALRNIFDMQNRRITTYAAALAYDDGPLQAALNYNRITSPHWPGQHLVYGHTGYRMENLTPYVSYAAVRSARNFVPTGIPQGISPQTDLVNAAMAQAQTSFMANQTDFALGLRYDFARNAALKLQADYIRYRDPIAIIDPAQFRQNALTRNAKSLTWYAVALDFVF